MRIVWMNIKRRFRRVFDRDELIFYGDDGMHFDYDSDERFYFYKRKITDRIWHVTPSIHRIGPMLFSFDKKTVYNYWPDYPNNLTPDQKKLFDKENSLIQ